MNDDRSALLTIAQAASYLNVSKASLRRWTNSGRLVSRRVGVRGERRFAVRDLEAFLQRPRRGADTSESLGDDPVAVLDDAAARGLPRHVCAHFGDAAEWRRLYVPFFRAHAALGAPIFYIHDATPPARYAEALTEAGFDAQAMLASGQIELVDSSHAYFPTGTFSASAMLAYVASVIDTARRRGHERALISGEMTWSLRGISGAHEMIGYEDRLNALLRDAPGVTIVCQYDSRRFDAHTALECVRVHPFVQTGSGFFRGFHAAAPERTSP